MPLVSFSLQVINSLTPTLHPLQPLPIFHLGLNHFIFQSFGVNNFDQQQRENIFHHVKKYETSVHRLLFIFLIVNVLVISKQLEISLVSSVDVFDVALRQLTEQHLTQFHPELLLALPS